MRKLKLKLWGVVSVCLLGLFVVSNSAVADVMNFTVNVPTGTMKDITDTSVLAGSGFVQVVKGSPSRSPSAVANDTTPAFTGGDVYATALVPPFAGQAIKGRVGDYVDVAGNGGFFLANQVDVPMSSSYYVRYWTEPQSDGYTYYGNSLTKTPWASGLPVPFEEPFTSFTLYQASTPPAPTALTATLTGYTADPVTYGPDKPIVDLVMTVDVSKHQITDYEFRIQQINPVSGGTIGDPVILPASGKTIQNKTVFALNSSYLIDARVRNNFATDPATWGPSPATRLDIGGVPAGPISLEYTLGPGIVQFAVSVDPTNADFKVNNGALTGNNIDAFLKRLNSNQISTFGWWDGAKPVGYIITWSGAAAPYTPTYTRVPNTTPLAVNVALEKDKVYQMSLGAPLSFTITGTR